MRNAIILISSMWACFLRNLTSYVYQTENCYNYFILTILSLTRMHFRVYNPTLSYSTIDEIKRHSRFQVIANIFNACLNIYLIVVWTSVKQKLSLYSGHSSLAVSP